MTNQDTLFLVSQFTLLTASDLDDLILVAAGKKAMMETYDLNTHQAYLEWLETSKKKRGAWLAKMLWEY